MNIRAARSREVARAFQSSWHSVLLRALSVTLLMSVSACSRTLHLEIPSDTSVELELVIFNNSGTTVVGSKEVVLQPGAPEYRHLQELLARNQRDWSRSVATNPPGGIMVHAGKLTMHFVNGTVFTWTDKDQFQKQIPTEDYAFLKKAVNLTNP